MTVTGGWMKNKKLLLFLIPLLFFIPNETFAAGYVYIPNHIDAYNDFSSWDSYADNCSLLYSSGSKFCQFNSSKSIRKVWFRYGSLPSGLSSGFYDISGQASTFMPISSVYYGTDICDIQFLDDDQLSVKFTCKNIYINNTFSGFYVLTSYNSNFSGTSYAISYDLTFNKSYTVNSYEVQNKTNELLESTDTTGAQEKSSSFFKNFSSDSHGLSGIITAPLSFLQALTSAKCNPLTFDLPFVDKTVTIPCMKAIYENYFGIFFTLWQTITTGVISYCVCLNFYKKIRDLQNPNNDKIEVLNL